MSHCPVVDESLGTDTTLGGMVYDDDFKPTGTKMRGESERRVIRRIEHREVGGCEKCWPVTDHVTPEEDR